MKPLDLAKTARILARGSQKRPRQSDLKRAVSTAYYALFHQLCENCANCLIGTQAADRSLPAWLQAYRSIDHGHAKRQCRNSQVMKKFPKDIEDFANLFQDLLVDRHAADYDPTSKFNRSDVLAMIATVEKTIKSFKGVPIKHRRAFAVWIVLKNRAE